MLSPTHIRIHTYAAWIPYATVALTLGPLQAMTNLCIIWTRSDDSFKARKVSVRVQKACV